MATAAVVGLTTGKRLSSASAFSSEFTERLLSSIDHGTARYPSGSSKTLIVARRSSNLRPNNLSNKGKQSIRAVKEQRDVGFLASTADSTFEEFSPSEEESDPAMESSLEALILLQKSMLEKQWNLSFGRSTEEETPEQWNLSFSQSTEEETPKEIQRSEIARSGLSARQRRNSTRRKCFQGNAHVSLLSKKRVQISSDLKRNHTGDYLNGSIDKKLLSHAEVVHLSKKIKAGLRLEDHRKRLEKKLGCKLSNQQLASSLRIPHAELEFKIVECSLAREKLLLSNVRLVMSIAKKFANMGVDMSDIVQGGLMGLLTGIEKFDHSRGYRLSTYVYWWIRQGISKVLVNTSRTIRLPMHIHERLWLIRNAKSRLEQKGVKPTLSNIAEHLNISEKKLRRATEANRKIRSLDKEAFPSLSGIPGNTFHIYVGDPRLDNNPWAGFKKKYVKDEVDKLLDTTLSNREKEIIRLYYGFGGKCLSWEEISRRVDLSRERVRQVGLVAMEKLKHEARKRRMDFLLQRIDL